MSIDKPLISGNMDILVLRLLKDRDMYGYQIIEELARQSNRTCELKADHCILYCICLNKRNILNPMTARLLPEKQENIIKQPTL